VKVVNIVGTAERSCKCGTWLNHWKKLSKSTAIFCSVQGCARPSEVGGHVRKDGLLGLIDPHSYIIPLCKNHNNQVNVSLEVGFPPMVGANVENTCGNSLLAYLETVGLRTKG
jgi:hypothetical protein